MGRLVDAEFKSVTEGERDEACEGTEDGVMEGGRVSG